LAPAKPARAPSLHVPSGATALLMLADGRTLWGHGFGAEGVAVGEVCFNTAMTGYQEVMTDPSYASQIVTFTAPHIGNTGANHEDLEADNPWALGCILRERPTAPSSFRSVQSFDSWMAANGRIGLAGVDTRALTQIIRREGALNAVIAHDRDGVFDLAALAEQARAWPGLEGMDLAKSVSRTQMARWDEGVWTLGAGYGRPSFALGTNGMGGAGPDAPGSSAEKSFVPSENEGRNPQSFVPSEVEGRGPERPHVVAIDYGSKRNIFRSLVHAGARVTILPATATAEEVLAHAPDGLFLSNGPGDPAATGAYAVPVIRALLDTGKPLFGICLGHQLLALAVGARTTKMFQGHRGANHPVKRLSDGRVEITSMNHGFAVERDSLPEGVRETHVSLFDGSNAGLGLTDRPAFSVQYHPEASPGPRDSRYLFDQFVSRLR